MTSATQRADAAVERLDVSAYTVATDRPESDGTLEWDSTTLVLVEAHAGGEVGVGYTYADVAAARLIESKLVDAVEGCDAMAVPAAWAAMVGAIRTSRPGCSVSHSPTCSGAPATACPCTAAAGSPLTASTSSSASSPGGWRPASRA